METPRYCPTSSSHFFWRLQHGKTKENQGKPVWTSRVPIEPIEVISSGTNMRPLRIDPDHPMVILVLYAYIYIYIYACIPVYVNTLCTYCNKQPQVAIPGQSGKTSNIPILLMKILLESSLDRQSHFLSKLDTAPDVWIDQRPFMEPKLEVTTICKVSVRA